jgi:hypothetical protein
MRHRRRPVGWAGFSPGDCTYIEAGDPRHLISGSDRKGPEPPTQAPLAAASTPPRQWRAAHHPWQEEQAKKAELPPWLPRRSS